MLNRATYLDDETQIVAIARRIGKLEDVDCPLLLATARDLTQVPAAIFNEALRRVAIKKMMDRGVPAVTAIKRAAILTSAL